MDLNRVVKAFDPIHMNEKLFEATDQLEKSRYSTAADVWLRSFRNLNFASPLQLSE